MLEEGRKITITDTVGFIQKLPTTLVESFKSTLAEARAADLLLLVADASDPHFADQIHEVKEILKEIAADKIKCVTVLNKCDLLAEEELQGLRGAYPQAVFVSALEDTGMRGLLYRIAQEASEGEKLITALIPYEKGLLLKMAHERCQVIREQYQDGGLLITVKASERMRATLKPYEVEG